MCGFTEMKPKKKSRPRTSRTTAEPVCSNSLDQTGFCNAVGLLKQEMRLMDNLIMRIADKNSVAAGGGARSKTGRIFQRYHGRDYLV